jgi:hypothetical protein
MIIMQIKGGLGNQLFQYALGRSLAVSNHCRLKLDLSWFENTKESLTYRKFKLDRFKIDADIATKEEVCSLKPPAGPLLKYRRALAHLVRFGRPRCVLENKNRSFDKPILGLKSPVWLEGYWQSFRYFSKIAGQIRAELRLTDELAAPTAEQLEKINRVNAVSLHIRRGDYVSNPVYARKYGTVTLEYYQKGISLMAQKIRNPHFVVFTDDYQWAKSNLKTEHPVLWMDREAAEKDCVDLWLMAHCRHHIIANSSYSWWGAWLADQPDKIVVNPVKWKSDESRYNSDRSPASWIAL